jgi:hypothetical protein
VSNFARKAVEKVSALSSLRCAPSKLVSPAGSGTAAGTPAPAATPQTGDRRHLATPTSPNRAVVAMGRTPDEHLIDVGGEHRQRQRGSQHADLGQAEECCELARRRTHAQSRQRPGQPA